MSINTKHPPRWDCSQIKLKQSRLLLTFYYYIHWTRCCADRYWELSQSVSSCFTFITCPIGLKKFYLCLPHTVAIINPAATEDTEAACHSWNPSLWKQQLYRFAEEHWLSEAVNFPWTPVCCDSQKQPVKSTPYIITPAAGYAFCNSGVCSTPPIPFLLRH